MIHAVFPGAPNEMCFLRIHAVFPGAPNEMCFLMIHAVFPGAPNEMCFVDRCQLCMLDNPDACEVCDPGWAPYGTQCVPGRNAASSLTLSPYFVKFHWQSQQTISSRSFS